jgi:predicted RNA-binding protein YlqC (UPF0109 family)
MRDFLIYILKNLVDQPDKIILDQDERDGKIIFTVQVAGDDVGKVIGRQGRTAIALRSLLMSVAAKEGKKAQLEIAD